MSAAWTRVVVLVATVALCLCCAYASAKAHHGYAACDKAVVQSSGYIDIPGVSGTQKHYFYWLFGPRRWPTDGSQPPVIMWMTGGPGCSSGIALAIELGPCEVNETSGELYRNAFGWNDEAYLLFVDQPTGVGYSYGDKANYVHNESEVAEDMYNFLQGFAKKFTSPSITGANDFYVIGESYAGHYIPAVSYRIFQGNQRGDGPVINLKGIGIGNGITDPYAQVPAYAEMAYNGCIAKTGKPCITEAAYEEMLSEMPGCMEHIKNCNDMSLGYDASNAECVRAFAVCEHYQSYYFNTGLNSYDVRKPCIGDLCYPMAHTLEFFNSSEVRSSLGVSDAAEWSTCNYEVQKLFQYDFVKNFNYTFPPMLAAGIRVLIYAGDCDFVCNWIGNKAWVTALEWPGKASFNAAADVKFSVAGRAAGEERVSGNFSFVRIYDAGHMVPMDQPETSLYMVSQFLHNRRLAPA